MTVLLIDDEEEGRRATKQSLDLADLPTLAFARAERALERVGHEFGGVVVTDIRMPGMGGMALLHAIHDIDPDLPVILITGHGDVPLAVQAMRDGAYDFLEKPFSPAKLVEAARRALELRRLTLENRAMRVKIDGSDPIDAALVGASHQMDDLRARLRAIAATDADVLLQGQTGVGKDLCARLIHDASERRDHPFVAINLAALPKTMVESELFGHEAGAFPGAFRARVGRFEYARRGTLFLDEIGAAPLSLQAKLLRAIEDRTIQRLGSNENVVLDIRIITSSNSDLDQLCKDGAFRPDLMYRLAVTTLTVPTLSDRIEDIPRLFAHFVLQASQRLHKDNPPLSSAFLADLTRRNWPGNVRELRNAAERFVLGLDFDDSIAPCDEQLSLALQMDVRERQVLATTLASYGGDLKATYKALNVSRKTLYEKMQKHGLNRAAFSSDLQ